MEIEQFGTILQEHGIRHGSGVPCSYFTPLVNYMGLNPGMDYVGAASEGEAVAIAAGLTAAGRSAFALMQNSGLGNAVNPITSLLYTFQIPVVLLVSHRGQPGRPDEPQHERMGQITEQLVELCGIECRVLGETGFATDLADILERGVPAAWVCQKGTLQKGPQAAALDLNIRVGGQIVLGEQNHRPLVSRERAVEAILPLLSPQNGRPAVVATTGKLSRELYELDDRDHSRGNRFYMVGSMGCASGFGLGVARGQQDRKVVVLDGDGALLMKLGSLATIGAHQPENLHHVCFDNGAHDSTGGQPTASPHVDFAAVARACGYRRADTVSDPQQFAAVLEAQLAEGGPTFLRMVIKTGARKELGRPKLAPRDGWLRFKAFLENQ